MRRPRPLVVSQIPNIPEFLGEEFKDNNYSDADESHYSSTLPPIRQASTLPELFPSPEPNSDSAHSLPLSAPSRSANDEFSGAASNNTCSTPCPLPPLLPERSDSKSSPFLCPDLTDRIPRGIGTVLDAEFSKVWCHGLVEEED
ncbi:hypothetical protein K438DRAFT_229939 [Mycena galopus ATCC 62051]|nr:hypothetical protein K438DRAFT_229939 [Mycena galopus ATCC 62051]